jgi:hypothetical protein
LFIVSGAAIPVPQSEPPTQYPGAAEFPKYWEQRNAAEYQAPQIPRVPFYPGPYSKGWKTPEEYAAAEGKKKSIASPPMFPNYYYQYQYDRPVDGNPSQVVPYYQEPTAPTTEYQSMHIREKRNESGWPDHIQSKALRMMQSAAAMELRGKQRMAAENEPELKAKPAAINPPKGQAPEAKGVPAKGCLKSAPSSSKAPERKGKKGPVAEVNSPRKTGYPSEEAKAVPPCNCKDSRKTAQTDPRNYGNDETKSRAPGSTGKYDKGDKKGEAPKGRKSHGGKGVKSRKGGKDIRQGKNKED